MAFRYRSIPSQILPVIFAALFLPTTALADLLVAPTRVVLDEETRTVSIALSNTSQETKVYRMSWQEYLAQEDGSYAVPETPRPDSLALQEMLRYSPRQVTLAPGEVQSIRLLLRPRGPVPDGEMRTHLTFVGFPAEAADGQDQSQAGIGIDLRFALAISIPVIFRKGDLDSDARISSAMVELVSDGQVQRPVVTLSLERSGTRSVFGDVEILTSGNRVVGLLRGVAVYPEVPRRIIRVPIDAPSGTVPDGLRARFRLPAEEGGTIESEVPVAQ